MSGEKLILLGCRIYGCGQLWMLQTGRNHSRPRLLLCIQTGRGCSGSVWDPHPQEDTLEVTHLYLSIPLRNNASEGSTDASVLLMQMPLMNRVTTHSRETGIMFTRLCMNILPTSHFLTNSPATGIHQGALTYTNLQAEWLSLEHFQV